jgi:hypothetical protein
VTSEVPLAGASSAQTAENAAWPFSTCRQPFSRAADSIFFFPGLERPQSSQASLNAICTRQACPDSEVSSSSPADDADRLKTTFQAYLNTAAFESCFWGTMRVFFGA